MRQFLLGLSFSVVFIVGCAVGTMQGSQVAQADAAEGSWECFHLTTRKHHTDDLASERLNEGAGDATAGQVVTINENTVCVKH